jgi:hypothetical protein
MAESASISVIRVFEVCGAAAYPEHWGPWFRGSFLAPLPEGFEARSSHLNQRRWAPGQDRRSSSSGAGGSELCKEIANVDKLPVSGGATWP